MQPSFQPQPRVHFFESERSVQRFIQDRSKSRKTNATVEELPNELHLFLISISTFARLLIANNGSNKTEESRRGRGNDSSNDGSSDHFYSLVSDPYFLVNTFPIFGRETEVGKKEKSQCNASRTLSIESYYARLHVHPSVPINATDYNRRCWPRQPFKSPYYSPSSPKFTTFLASRKRISFHSSPHATALKFMRGLEWNGENWNCQALSNGEKYSSLLI